MTIPEAYRQTVERWEAFAEGRCGIACGFCCYVVMECSSSTCSPCPLILATRKSCRGFKLLDNWNHARLKHGIDSPEAKKWARHIVAYLKRLGKREGWT